MDNQSKPSSREEYEGRKEIYDKELGELVKKSNFLSNIRTVVFLIGTSIAVLLYFKGYREGSGMLLLTTLLIFAILVIFHNRVKNSKNYASVLLDINKKSLERLEGRWTQFPDDGEEFIDEEHPYTGDLDVFGKGSLFQWINATHTYMGKIKLKTLFEQPIQKVEDIVRRQEAIKELAAKLDYRQKFEAEVIASHGKPENLADLVKWAGELNKGELNRHWAMVVKVLPFLTLMTVILSFIFPEIPRYLFLVPLTVQVALIAIRYPENSTILHSVGRYSNTLSSYEKLLRMMESESFSSQFLQQLQNSLKNEKGDTACRQMKKLAKVANRTSFCYSQFYFFFNIATLWDYRCRMALESWKRDSGPYIGRWLDAIGEMEALSSISIIAFDHPKWVFPQISEKPMHIKALGLGHPLLHDSVRICNDIALEKTGMVLIITGSNMSGKSTFLRTAGINLIMAYAGAPVCAEEFSCSLMDIYTSMRTRDNLKKNISSFYAELLRIKEIVEASCKSENVFFLLDEIFKGTNSRDRHVGAKVLIQKLSDAGAMGMVSTHDLELGDWAGMNNEKVKNYHFREFYKDGQIYFDYKLQKGVSTTRNAIYLMRMAGIDVEETDT